MVYGQKKWHVAVTACFECNVRAFNTQYAYSDPYCTSMYICVDLDVCVSPFGVMS